jgi:hypothetical protein
MTDHTAKPLSLYELETLKSLLRKRAQLRFEARIVRRGIVTVLRKSYAEVVMGLQAEADVADALLKVVDSMVDANYKRLSQTYGDATPNGYARIRMTYRKAERELREEATRDGQDLANTWGWELI